MRAVLWHLIFALVALAAVCAAIAQDKPVLRVVYFVPGDLTPIPGYEQRIDKVMREVQGFYRKGMDANGYTRMTFALDREPTGQLQIHLVTGRLRSTQYNRQSTDAIMDEVRKQLVKDGLNPRRETMVVFQELLTWKNGVATEVGPYCGSGSNKNGFALVYDDALLDPDKLSSKEPGGYYGRPDSIGDFNSHYIGGIAHELGHALGLPHDAEKAADRAKGISLMGSGNHVYGRDLRGEGQGTVLSAASAMLLSHHPLFTGTREGSDTAPACSIEGLDARMSGGKLVLTGKIQATPKVFGLVAYNDNTVPPADYDAVGWVSSVGNDGVFRDEVSEIKSGQYQLRLRVCHVNGACSEFAYDYKADANGVPSVSELQQSFIVADAVAALEASDAKKVKAAAARLKAAFPDDADASRKASLLVRLSNPSTPQAADGVPQTEKSCWLSDLAFSDAKVGYGKPMVDQVMPEVGTPFLTVDGKFYDHGFWGHAPSRYVFDLKGAWKSLHLGCGLQDGHAGSVSFVIIADQKELFRSPVVKDHTLHEATVDLSGIQSLTLIVENGWDGNDSDWGIWVNPKLTR